MPLSLMTKCYFPLLVTHFGRIARCRHQALPPATGYWYPVMFLLKYRRSAKTVEAICILFHWCAPENLREWSRHLRPPFGGDRMFDGKQERRRAQCARQRQHDTCRMCKSREDDPTCVRTERIQFVAFFI